MQRGKNVKKSNKVNETAMSATFLALRRQGSARTSWELSRTPHTYTGIWIRGGARGEVKKGGKEEDREETEGDRRRRGGAMKPQCYVRYRMKGWPG